MSQSGQWHGAYAVSARALSLSLSEKLPSRMKVVFCSVRITRSCRLKPDQCGLIDIPSLVMTTPDQLLVHSTARISMRSENKCFSNAPNLKTLRASRHQYLNLESCVRTVNEKKSQQQRQGFSVEGVSFPTDRQTDRQTMLLRTGVLFEVSD